jgi:hypothetical protein
MPITVREPATGAGEYGAGVLDMLEDMAENDRVETFGRLVFLEQRVDHGDAGESPGQVLAERSRPLHHC